MKHWWKLLAVLLVAYTLFVGLTIPLRTGIISGKSEMSLASGQQQELKVRFYNSRYTKEKPEAIVARLRIDTTKAICADAVKIVDDRTLLLSFNLPTLDPKKLPAAFPFVEIGSPENGYVFSSIFIKKADSLAPVVEKANYCKPEYLSPTTKITLPFLNILEETIRNLFYHVPMWFGMMLLLLVSVVFSIKQLQEQEGLNHDIAAKTFAAVGVLYGVLGIVTGAIWAKHTWGAYWSWDVKQNTSAVALLIYLAYFVLRSSFDDADKKARISAVYNIFAFAALIPLLYIIPRMVNSLHPGAEGNPAFSSYDLDSNMRLIFYPAVIGWILMGVWIATIWIRIEKIWQKKMELL